jgi:hypothetical protein
MSTAKKLHFTPFLETFRLTLLFLKEISLFRSAIVRFARYFAKVLDVTRVRDALSFTHIIYIPLFVCLVDAPLKFESGDLAVGW